MSVVTENLNINRDDEQPCGSRQIKTNIEEENTDVAGVNEKSGTDAEQSGGSSQIKTNLIDSSDNSDDSHEEDNEPKYDVQSNVPSSSDDGSNMSVVATHYNELKEAGRQERLKSKIFYMRNFNNWIKSQLISEYIAKIKQEYCIGDPLRVLDMCCGKGGDLLKWEKSNITHLICTDIAEVSVEQCKKRYEDMSARAERTKYANKFSAEFIACDSTLVRLRERYKDPSRKLNLVSCQFAFHYSFESLTQADCMVRNAAECLLPGGYFIATIPDANEIMRRLSKSKSRSFGNDLYRIEFQCDTNPPPLFGAKYLFHLEGVVDCPEFLVYFPVLEKLCLKHGLKLIEKKTFAEYFTESLERGRPLLQRMSGLESVQPNRCNTDEYIHVRNMIKGGNLSRTFGTLSKSEWEAASLYLVCAFKKAKNSWDTQGKPVFQFDD